MADDQTYTDLVFPIRGVDIAGEFGSQREGTTPEAKNVRAFEPGTERMRGGSRSGIVKYPPEQVTFEIDSFDNVIQHLGVIVDPSSDAILANFDDGTDNRDSSSGSGIGLSGGGKAGTYTDTSSNNLRRRRSEFFTRKIRDGGSGRRQGRFSPKQVVTITANDQTKTYGTTLSLGTSAFTVSGLAVGDSVTSVTLNSRGAVNTAVVPPSGRTYRIIPSAAVFTGVAPASGNYAHKYRIRYVPGKLTVNKAALTVTASNRTKTSGQALQLGTSQFTTSGLLLSDTVTSVRLKSDGAPASASFSGSPYTITVSDARSSTNALTTRLLGNYEITYVSGSLTLDALVQSRQPTSSTTGTTETINKTLAFTSNVTSGNMLLVFAYTANQETAATISVLSISDTLGNTYTLAGVKDIVNGLTSHRVTCYYVVTTDSGANTVSVTATGPAGDDKVMDIFIVELAGVTTLDGIASDSGVTTSGTKSTGTITVTGSSDIIVAAVSSGWGAPASGTGFTTILDGNFGYTYNASLIEYKMNVSSSQAATTVLSGSGSRQWIILGVSLK